MLAWTGPWDSRGLWDLEFVDDQHMKMAVL